MKKFLVLFLSMAFLFACSNDDDNEEPQGDDPIVGTWVLVDASEPLDSQFCFEEESTITFKANNTGQATFYLTGTECSANNSQGTWSNNGNSVYTISVPVAGNILGTADFTSANRFTFTTTIFTIPGVITFERQ